ncbi:MAG: PEP-CTERM sorting domain-containing protein, partial [Pirellulales bacterium]|nr:PEP-CTERM sorting domain-containing protein [Pirellulales bacterium]
ALLSTTEPGSINIAALDSITWDANADNADDEYRVAIQVGGVWYASNPGQSDGQTDQGANGPFVGLSYSPASFATASNWLVIENATVGDSDPLSLGAAPGANLSGNVTAFGLYLIAGTNNEANGDHVRFDNYAINATEIAIPEPSSIGLVVLGLISLGITRRSRRA